MTGGNRTGLKLSRRAALAGAAATLFAATLTGRSTAARAQEGPASEFMNRIAKDLFKVAQSGSKKAFLRAINRYADVGAITEYSLGAYVEQVQGVARTRLRRGVAGFMARYFADQVRKYQVERAEITGEEPYDAAKGETLVASRVYLSGGSSYSVDWLLAEQASSRGSRYKVRDVRILGFLWLGYYQKRLFVNHIDKHGGDVAALFAALRV